MKELKIGIKMEIIDNRTEMKFDEFGACYSDFEWQFSEIYLRNCFVWRGGLPAKFAYDVAKVSTSIDTKSCRKR